MDNFGTVMGASQSAITFLDNLKNITRWSFILDILIVSILFYWMYLFLRETRAMRILYGLFSLIILTVIGQQFNLIMLNWILKYFMTMLVVTIPIVFQPELRAALEKLGRSNFWGEISLSKSKNSELIDSITQTLLNCASVKTGCLIVLQRQTGLREYVETGVKINADISPTLLMSTFFPKSPMHDGAVIISGNKILSAKSILPVSNASINPGLGTRHRAGLGITEISDAAAFMVSEETGIVSMALNGKLERRVSEERIRQRLAYLLRSISKENG